MTKSQARALLVVNAHYLQWVRKNLPEDLSMAELREVNVSLAFWATAWLDGLYLALNGPAFLRSVPTETPQDAVIRCLKAIEAKTGLRFPRPVVTAVQALSLPEGDRIRRTPKRAPARSRRGRVLT